MVPPLVTFALNRDDCPNPSVAGVVVKRCNVSESLVKQRQHLRSESIGQPGKRGEDHPAAQPRLESKHDSSGWLRRVCPAVSVQGLESEVRVLVHKTPVFTTQGEMPRQDIISACSVQEGAPSLFVGAGNKPARVAGGIKNQAAAPSERVSTDPSKAQWKVDH